MPSWAQVRRRAQDLFLAEGEMAGLPLPIEGHAIRMSPRHHDPRELEGARLDSPRGEDRTCSSEDMLWRCRNSWYSRRLRTQVMVGWLGQPGDPDFKVEVAYSRWDYAVEPQRRLNRLLDTLNVAGQAWDLEAELKAVQKLSDLISPHQLKLYLTAGAFLESSERSQARYLFRRSRPTLVLLPARSGNLTVSCALCLHPLAYYDHTFAGGMVPTDDVIAHLLLMRSDEHRYWREANQHPPWKIEAGL